MIHRAYSDHIPITISPDDFWFCISQGFARHINLNAEKYRKRLVGFEGKKEIEIERHDFIKGSDLNNWASVFSEFEDKIKQYVGNTAEMVTSEFSTTDVVSKIAFQVSLMDGMQQFFDYSVLTMCGIPTINVLGTKEDWKNIKERVKILSSFDLEWWTDRLIPILNNIIKSFDGSVDKSFWNSIYKHEDHGSGGPHVTGWINEFFPYIQNSESKIVASYMMVSDRGYKSKNLSTSAFPSSIAQVPFIWKYYNDRLLMDFTAGHIGYSQADDGSLKAVMGWGILNRPKKKVNKKKLERKRLQEERRAKWKKEREARDAAEKILKEKTEKLQNKLISTYKAKDPGATNLTMEKGLIKRKFVPKD